MISVFLADDHEIVRLGLKTVLELEEDITVVGDASVAATTIQKCRELKPDVLLLDLRMPGSGHSVIPELVAEIPQVIIIVFSTSETEEDIARAMSAGAKAYLPKSTDVREVVAALRAAKNGTLSPSPDVGRILENHAATGHLTERELEILALVAKGCTNRDIARMFEFSVHTAKAHVAKILEKMEVADRTEAATEAIRRGLLQE